LITRIILGDEYRSLSSSLRSFLHSPVAPSLLGRNILLSTLFSNSLWRAAHSCAVICVALDVLVSTCVRCAALVRLFVFRTLLCSRFTYIVGRLFAVK
jgi:hypothetical protein